MTLAPIAAIVEATWCRTTPVSYLAWLHLCLVGNAMSHANSPDEPTSMYASPIAFLHPSNTCTTSEDNEQVTLVSFPMFLLSTMCTMCTMCDRGQPLQLHTCISCAAAEEQNMVERYYVSVSSGSTYYYIGVERVGRLWYWPDGTSAGNGQPSNANPYAHWYVAGSDGLAVTGLSLCA
jgi:hypothetical protein